MPAATGTAAPRNSGYAERSDLRYFEKLDHVGASDASLLAALGGQVMPRGLWQAMAGMEAEKAGHRARIVLPLAERTRAVDGLVAPEKAGSLPFGGTAGSLVVGGRYVEACAPSTRWISGFICCSC
jgi:hypothetical protein